MTVKKLVEKIEGEAELDFTLRDGRVEDVQIGFGFYRGIEEILHDKDARDALVITPRVCGICNHAHLLAAVHALEDGYTRAGLPVTLSPKARAIREFTLSGELIQNHVKWLYLTILPYLEKLAQTARRENHALKASYLATRITKAIAIFAGQWPHSSYAVPGGVTCDPTYIDVMQARSLVEEAIRFFEEVMTGMPMEEYLSLESLNELGGLGGDFGATLRLAGQAGLARQGRSHDRFIVLSDGLIFSSGKALPTRVSSVDPRYVEEGAPNGNAARVVTYKNRLYEVGPLARAMVAGTPIIKSLHRRYKDALVTRIFARIHEIALLLRYSHELLGSLRLDEPSCTLTERTRTPNTFEGTGLIEAARGSLIHRTRVHDGHIRSYDIIVPTQWNLSQGTKTEPGIAVTAMTGSQSTDEASFIFRAFDICSVCTIQ